MKRLSLMLAVVAVVSMGSTVYATEPTAGNLPAGHPAIGGNQQPEGALPAGHPALNAQSAVAKSIAGTILIQAVQSTSNGPKIGADKFAIEFRCKDQLLDRFEGTLDANGAASIGGIPLPLNPQATVTVIHGDVEYRAQTQVMTTSTPQVICQIPVYETTDKAPDWQIEMAHVLIEPVPGAVRVTEMMAIENPGDRAWTTNASFALPLPAEAEQVKFLAGFSDAASKIKQGKLVTTAPMIPGDTQYQLSYVLPAPAGNVDVTFVAPAKLGHLMVLVPADFKIVRATNLTEGGVASTSRGSSRFFTAIDTPENTELKLSISGLSVK